MRRVIYSMSVSLDGFIAGPDGAIDWSAPDEELMAFHNEQSRELDAHLCGRGLYEDMPALGWSTCATGGCRRGSAAPRAARSRLRRARSAVAQGRGAPG